MRVLDRVTGAGGRIDEDRLGAAGAAAWVIDGCTGLAADLVPGVASDAAWYAGELSAAFADLSAEAEPDAVMRGAIRRLAARFAAATTGRPAPAPYEVPSAAAGWIRRGADGAVDYAGLGDCVVLVAGPEGGSRRLGSRQAEPDWAGDAWLNAAIRRLHAEGVEGPAAVWAELGGTLRDRRARMNRPDGYWIFAVDPAAADHLERDRLMPPRDAAALLMTDGFYRLVDHYRAYDHDGLVAAAREHGLVALYRELRAIETADADCRRFPRLKPSDDAAAMLVALDG